MCCTCSKTATKSYLTNLQEGKKKALLIMSTDNGLHFCSCFVFVFATGREKTTFSSKLFFLYTL